MRTVLYSAIIGGKDDVKDVTELSNYVPCILYTDDKNLIGVEYKGWQCVSDETGLPPRLASRYYKMLPHKLAAISRADYSVYIDGKVEPLYPEFLGAMVNSLLYPTPKAIAMSVLKPYMTDIKDAYDEAELVLAINRYPAAPIDAQIAAYRAAGLPEGSGIYNCTVVVRKHNHPYVMSVGEAWYRECEKHTTRDQISLPYVLWKTGYNVNTISYPVYEALAKEHDHLKDSSDVS